MKMAVVAVLCDKRTAERRWAYGLNVFEKYIEEILSHEGIPYVCLGDLDQLDQTGANILIVALADDKKQTADTIKAFAEQGGLVISYGGLPKLAAQLDCTQCPPLSVGYARLPASLGDPRPLRGLQIAPWERTAGASPSDVIQSGAVHLRHPEGRELGAALQQFPIGQGWIERWSVNIPLTVVLMQQGTGPVLADGIPAPDGTARLDEDILKADDALALDWQLDREATETGQKYFAHPYADLWREACVTHLLRSSLKLGLTLPFIGKWPDGISRVATISHDSDGNQDVHAESTLKVLQQHDVRSTWCMLEPGYSTSIYDQVREAGHELAFHYNSVVHEGKEWSQASFDKQHEWFRQATGEPGAISLKNHYTRFEGWGELFAWCEQNGIQSDQTRGSSKPGNVGFLFGTCQPYLPIAWADERNRMYDVVEISFLTQDMDLNAWADSSVIGPFLEQVKRVDGGVAHFLFHQVHIHNWEQVRSAFAKLADSAKELGFVFWTAREINDWVRLRRRAGIAGVDESGQVALDGDVPDGLTVYVPVAEAASADTTDKFGIPCKKVVFTTKREKV